MHVVMKGLTEKALNLQRCLTPTQLMFFFFLWFD